MLGEVVMLVGKKYGILSCPCPRFDFRVTDPRAE